MFPEDFLWGASSSGFQSEMGDREGRSLDRLSDWFKWVHDSENIRRKAVSGDMPEDGINYWEHYRADHALAKGLGMNAYRLGIEWSRIFPGSTKGVSVDIDEASDGGVSRVSLDDDNLQRLESLASTESLKHYEAVIDDLRGKGLRVIVCLNHFTLPLWVHDPVLVRDSRLRRGPRGWYDRATVIEFAKYAAYLAWKLRGMVDMWATINEPMIVAELGYFLGTPSFPPGIRNNFTALKRVATNMAMGHARAYDMIKKFGGDKEGAASVGLMNHVLPVRPRDSSRLKDVQAAEIVDRMHNFFVVEASTSGWLDLNLDGVRDSDEVKDYLSDRLDWLGVDYYSRALVEGKQALLARAFAGLPVLPAFVKGYGLHCEANSRSHDGNPTSDFGWEHYPQGLPQALVEMSRYGRPMIVAENGVADAGDQLRSRYILEHLQALENILEEKHLPVKGYLHWALTDNYEWAEGYTKRFGLVKVDATTKQRLPRRSAEVFHRIVDSGTTEGIHA